MWHANRNPTLSETEFRPNVLTLEKSANLIRVLFTSHTTPRLHHEVTSPQRNVSEKPVPVPLQQRCDGAKRETALAKGARLHSNTHPHYPMGMWKQIHVFPAFPTWCKRNAWDGWGGGRSRFFGPVDIEWDCGILEGSERHRVAHHTVVRWMLSQLRITQLMTFTYGSWLVSSLVSSQRRRHRTPWDHAGT